MRVETEQLPAGLVELSLRDNLLPALPPATLLHLAGHINRTGLTVRLGGNPFSCSCSALPLLVFLRQHAQHVPDHPDVTVRCPHRTRRLLEMTDDEICPNILLPILLSSIITILVVSTICILWFCRSSISVYIFSTSWGKRMFSQDVLDQNKTFDVFLSYSHEGWLH